MTEALNVTPAMAGGGGGAAGRGTPASDTWGTARG